MIWVKVENEINISDNQTDTLCKFIRNQAEGSTNYDLFCHEEEEDEEVLHGGRPSYNLQIKTACY